MFVGEKQLKLSSLREFLRGWGNRSFLSMSGGQINFPETFFFYGFILPTLRRSDRPPKTCTIKFKQGKWYASITVDCVPSRIHTDIGAIGLDLYQFALTLLQMKLANTRRMTSDV